MLTFYVFVWNLMNYNEKRGFSTVRPQINEKRQTTLQNTILMYQTQGRGGHCGQARSWCNSWVMFLDLEIQGEFLESVLWDLLWHTLVLCNVWPWRVFFFVQHVNLDVAARWSCGVHEDLKKPARPRRINVSRCGCVMRGECREQVSLHRVCVSVYGCLICCTLFMWSVMLIDAC